MYLARIDTDMSYERYAEEEYVERKRGQQEMMER